MGSRRLGGVGPSAAAVLAAFVVAIAVVAMVSIGGGVDQPLVAPQPHVAVVPVAPTQG